MANAVRTTFEKTLQERLTVALADQPRLTVLRTEVKIRAASGKDVVGCLALDHVVSARGYVLLTHAEQPPELRALREQVSPPYGSRKLTEIGLAAISSNERSREFAPTAGGAVRLPTDEGDIVSTCEWVVGRLTEIFVPRLLDFVDLRPGVVANVLEDPDDYAWPVLTVVAAMRKNGMTSADVDVDRLLGKKISRNRAFDASLLADLR